MANRPNNIAFSRSQYGRQIAGETLTDFGVRAYRRHWWSTQVTLIFEDVQGKPTITMKLHGPGSPLMEVNFFLRMLGSHVNLQEGTVDKIELKSVRDPFLSSGYNEEVIRLVAMQLANREVASRRRSSEKTQEEIPPAQEIEDYQKRDFGPRLDWSLLLAQLIGVATFLFLSQRPDHQDLVLGRLIVCGLSAYTAYVAVILSRSGWAWILGSLAAIYNPFIAVHMRVPEWAAMDLIGAVILSVSAFQVTLRPFLHIS